MAGRSERPRRFLDDKEKAQVLEAIQAAELRTSGELRVHLERKVPRRVNGDPYLRARELFAGMGMHATAARNGVLFYLATGSRRFTVLGDEKLHQRLPEGFWEDVVARMAEHFVDDRFGDGLAAGIAYVGERLAEHFPYQSDDVNELPDEISYAD